MLKLIESSYASFFPKEMNAMFRNRAETFSERLGWEVVVKDGFERDCFDDANPLYLVSVDPDTEEYWGSLRLLPTTGPNMLRDVFPQLLDGGYLESATIWESSRICAASVAGQPERSRSRINYVLSELILGIGEVAVAAGLDANRVCLRRQDFPRSEGGRMQPPRLLGRHNALAGSCATPASSRPAKGRSRRFAPQQRIEHSVLPQAPERWRSPERARRSPDRTDRTSMQKCRRPESSANTRAEHYCSA